MKVTAKDLLDCGIADLIVEEPEGGAHMNHDLSADIVKKIIIEQYALIKDYPLEEWVPS